MTAQFGSAELARYGDFIAAHSAAGSYDPELALAGLLSALTPDYKAVVLLAMEESETYFYASELNAAVTRLLRENGLVRSAPLSRRAVWNYCASYDHEGNAVDGSLVSVAAVVKEAYMAVGGGMKEGYRIAGAGLDFGKPLAINAMEFVSRADASDPGRCHSVEQVLGTTSTAFPGKRRQPAVFKLARFLLQNPGAHRREDLAHALAGELSYGVTAYLLNSLGRCGVIDYLSPERDVLGERTSLMVYRATEAILSLRDVEAARERLREVAPRFERPGLLARVVEWIQAHPQERISSDLLALGVRADRHAVSRLLASLGRVGLLEAESDLRGGRVQSLARANELTRLLDELILQPAWDCARSLRGPRPGRLEPGKLEAFLRSYVSGRRHLGPAAGPATRRSLAAILSGSGDMKLSHLTELVNRESGRRMSSAVVGYHLARMIREGSIEKTKDGYYRGRR